MSFIQLIDYQVLGDERGNLVSLEQNKNIPFEVKRIYYIFGSSENIERGFHAHKELKQIAICIHGSCDVMMDDGINQDTVSLNKPSQGLYIEPMQWHVMKNFSSDCVFLVLADDYYNESDYIRNYDEFLNEVQK